MFYKKKKTQEKETDKKNTSLKGFLASDWPTCCLPRRSMDSCFDVDLF